MAVADSAVRTPRTYGNWRQPTSPGMLGLGSVGTGVLFGCLVVVVIVVAVTNLLGGVIAAVPMGIVLLMVVVRDKHGLNASDRVGERVAWWRQRSRGEHLYRAGPLGRSPWGTFQLPGLLASTRLSEHKDSYGRPFALLEVPSKGTFTVVVGCDPDGSALVDSEQVDRWVAHWGVWLSQLGDEPGLEAASVTVETAPDSGSRLRREVVGHMDDEAPAFARAVLAETVDSYPAGSSTITAYVALTFKAASRTGSRKRRAEEMGRDLASRLPGLTGALSATGAGSVRLVAAGELCEVVRTAFDPSAAAWIDRAHAEGEDVDLRWSDVGPAAHQAAWGEYQHDSAVSVTWAMTAAPRGQVQSQILERLLRPSTEITRKRVTLLYGPSDPATAAGIIEADVRATNFKATSSNRPSARALVDKRAAEQTAAEEAAGAGLVNFGMLVTATVSDAEQLPDAKATVDNLGATARLLLRPAFGAQDAAFAAALPLGLVLSKYLTVPKPIRNNV